VDAVVGRTSGERPGVLIDVVRDAASLLKTLAGKSIFEGQKSIP
jgi:hypothetical protein